MGGGTYIRAGSSKNTSIIFSLTEGVGALAEALKVFKVSYYRIHPMVSRIFCNYESPNFSRTQLLNVNNSNLI